MSDLFTDDDVAAAEDRMRQAAVSGDRLRPVEYAGTTEDEHGLPWVRLSPDGGAVLWQCPLCRRGFYGVVADEPVSGWDAPRWRVTVTDGLITLEPSLGCSGMRDGSCPGHWWVRDGKLVSA